MFELAAGAMSSQSGGIPLNYLVIDTQTCPLDVPLGDTGLSALGCVRLAGASFKTAAFFYGNGGMVPQDGGALWFGAGARLRWQTASLFFEGSLDAVYGTVSGGESTSPGWVDASAGVGFRL
jgi:hypothetical protein